MGVDIRWQITSATYLDGVTSSVADVLKAAFGSFPFLLEYGEKTNGVLHGLAIGCATQPNPYQQLLDALIVHKSITVFRE